MFPRFVFSFQQCDKPAEIRWIDVAEPRAFLFEVKFSWNVNSFRPEVVKLPRDESELLVHLKIVKGLYVVTPCLFIGACLHGLLLFESAIGEVLPSRKLFIDPHCVNKLPMAGAFPLIRPGQYQ